MKNIFKQGALSPTLVAESIAKHQVKSWIRGIYSWVSEFNIDRLPFPKVN